MQSGGKSCHASRSAFPHKKPVDIPRTRANFRAIDPSSAKKAAAHHALQHTPRRETVLRDKISTVFHGAIGVTIAFGVGCTVCSYKAAAAFKTR